MSLIYLPDLEHPVYARARSGYGSANLTLAFANGMITSFGQQTDTKIPETLTSLGGVGSAIATATKTFAEAAVLEKQSGDFGKYADQINDIIKDLKRLVGQKDQVLTSGDKKTIEGIIAALDDLEKKFKAPGAIARTDTLAGELEKVIKEFSGLTPPPDNLLTDPVKEVWGTITIIKNKLGMILDELKPKAAALPAFSLYEIIMKGSKTTFKEVSLDRL